MIAFFDTNIYIDYLSGTFSASLYERFFSDYIIRLCPVVYHELIRGIRNDKLKRKVIGATKNIQFLPTPTHAMWMQAGELAGKVFPSFEEKSLAKIQNDLLIALTAKQNGAILITQDKHFKMIQKHLTFKLQFVRFDFS